MTASQIRKLYQVQFWQKKKKRENRNGDFFLWHLATRIVSLMRGDDELIMRFRFILLGVVGQLGRSL
jgi:hypothetical protein